MLRNNKQFIIYFWAYPPKPLFCKFFLIEPQIDHFHVALGYFKPTSILSLLKINFFSRKLINLILAYHETWQTSFSKFHANRELTSVPAKKICSFSKFFSQAILLFQATPVRWYAWAYGIFL